MDTTGQTVVMESFVTAGWPEQSQSYNQDTEVITFVFFLEIKSF